MKVARVEGQLAWHSRENEVGFFLVLRGHLRIKLDEVALELRAGESFVVPKGGRHNPVADGECLQITDKRKSTLHTGDTHER